MPRIVWLFVAGTLIGERWGWPGILGFAAAEAAGFFLTGFYEAWRADRGA